MAKKKTVSPEVRIQKMLAKATEMEKQAKATEAYMKAKRNLERAKAL